MSCLEGDDSRTNSQELGELPSHLPRAYIDESGDAVISSLNRGASDYFVVSAVLVSSKDHEEFQRVAEAARKEFFPSGEIKSSRLKKHPERRRVLPEVKSRRQQSLDLIRAVCRELGTAVRMGEIRSAAEAEGLDADMVARDVANLTRTRHLLVVDNIIGDGTGDNLYCPAGMEEAVTVPTRPLTWLEEVDAVCARLWAERVERA